MHQVSVIVTMSTIRGKEAQFSLNETEALADVAENIGLNANLTQTFFVKRHIKTTPKRTDINT